MNYKRTISEILAHHITDGDAGEIYTAIEVPPQPDMGDYAFPCFRLAKTFRKAPHAIAQQLTQDIKLPSVFASVESAGGYLNFFLNRKHFAQEIISKILSAHQEYGSGDEGKGKTICVDFSCPNIAKPFHVGHLRSTVIGNAIYNIYKFLGYRCVGINHLGDWGTQFGKVIVAYKHWGVREEIEAEPISTLLKLYVRFHEEVVQNPGLDDEARAWFVRLEERDQEAVRLWQWFSLETIKELKKLYALLGVTFDHYTGESFYNDKMEAVLTELRQKNLLVKDQGATLIDLSDYDMPPCLVEKSDGSTLYITRDIAAVMYRKKTYNFDKCLYVTDYSQNLHFAQLFKIVELLGYPWAKDLLHIPFGRVTHEGRRMQTRKGAVVLLEEVLSGAIDRVREIIEEKNPSLANKEEIATQVGVGAVIFNDLSNNRIKDISFSWETAFSFEGETGPYVQYTYARASSVLRRAKADIELDIKADLLTDDITLSLLKTLHQFPEAVRDAQRKNEPSVLTRHIVDIAQAFNRFYHDHPVLVEDQELRQARLAVVAAARQTIGTGLRLLGIATPQRM